ncbi:hypothetical protein JYT31_03445, partial [Beggiatoa alba]|nr:hypothetical protein [Beggiatoa alba]
MKNPKKHFLLLLLIVGITACGGGGGSTSTDTTVTGTVSAPGGSVAFNPPGKLERFAASIFGAPALAAISGIATVGAGVTIELIEVDASGNKVGATIATTTTDASGAYSFSVSASITPNSQYI